MPPARPRPSWHGSARASCVRTLTACFRSRRLVRRCAPSRTGPRRAALCCRSDERPEETAMTSVVIDKRFCGPPNSGNGGYVCGLLAAHLDADAEVTLLAPPPLDERLDIVTGDQGVELWKDETILARARSVRFEVPDVPRVDFSEAENAVSR